jgi:predicted nucleic acid-binding protein
LIVYLDTSALIPLVIDEPSSLICARLWDESDEVVSVRITYVEAAAALAQARRLGRLTRAAHRRASGVLDGVWTQLLPLDVDERLVRRAGQLADPHQLRGYDATHCAGAEAVGVADLVAASGDRQLLAAWRALGLNTLDINAV